MPVFRVQGAKGMASLEERGTELGHGKYEWPISTMNGEKKEGAQTNKWEMVDHEK